MHIDLDSKVDLFALITKHYLDTWVLISCLLKSIGCYISCTNKAVCPTLHSISVLTSVIIPSGLRSEIFFLISVMKSGFTQNLETLSTDREIIIIKYSVENSLGEDQHGSVGHCLSFFDNFSCYKHHFFPIWGKQAPYVDW